MKKILATAAVAGLAGLASAQPGSFTDLGVITGDTSFDLQIAPNEVAWYRLEIGTVPYFDATTSGGNTNIDTEMGLYDALGMLVANDDDNGVGLQSTLTFGTGSGLLLGDGFNLGGDGIADGENGPLGAGVYWLALGEFNVTFNPDSWDVISDGTDTGGTITLSIYTVPAPASAALLGLGGLVATRRRRA